MKTYHEIINYTTGEIYHYSTETHTEVTAVLHARNNYAGWGIMLRYNGIVMIPN